MAQGGKVPFHHEHHRDLRDSRSRILGPRVDPPVLLPPPNLPPLLSRPCPVESVSSAGGPPRLRATSPRRRARGPEAVSTLGPHAPGFLPGSQARGTRKSEGAKLHRPTLTRQQHAQHRRLPPTSSARKRSAGAAGGARVPRAPGLPSKRRPTSSRTARTLPVKGHAHSHRLLFTRGVEQRKPRPLRRSPAPRRRPGWRAHAPKRVPAPGPLPRGPRSSRLCHLTVVVARGGRGARAAWGCERGRTASSPPSGRARAWSPRAPSAPHPGGSGQVRAAAGCRRGVVAAAATGPDGVVEPLPGEALRV